MKHKFLLLLIGLAVSTKTVYGINPLGLLGKFNLSPQPVIDMNMKKLFDTVAEGIDIFNNIVSLASHQISSCQQALSYAKNYQGHPLEKLKRFQLLKQEIKTGLETYKAIRDTIIKKCRGKMTLGERIHSIMKTMEALDKASKAAEELKEIMDSYQKEAKRIKEAREDFHHCMRLFSRRKRL